MGTFIISFLLETTVSLIDSLQFHIIYIRVTKRNKFTITKNLNEAILNSIRCKLGSRFIKAN